MPCSINRFTMAGERLAGPMVQTILALRMLVSNGWEVKVARLFDRAVHNPVFSFSFIHQPIEWLGHRIDSQ